MIKKLSAKEISEALEGTDWPPILTLDEAAVLLKLSPKTLYRHLSEGRYVSAVKRGKPVRFWRDRLIQEFMR